MAGRGKHDRRGSGPWWFIALTVVLYFLFSLVVAASTAEDCRGASQHWEFFPPAWECDARPGFG